MADDIYIGGRQLKSPPVKPQWDTEDTRKGDEPTKETKFDISNPPAADISSHPIQQHFAKKAAGIRRTGTPVKISEN